MSDTADGDTDHWALTMSRGEDGNPTPGAPTWSGVAINIGTIHCQPLLTTIRRQQADKGTRSVLSAGDQPSS